VALQNLADIEVRVEVQPQVELLGRSVEVHYAVLELNAVGVVRIGFGQTKDDLLFGDGVDQAFLDHVILALLLEPKNNSLSKMHERNTFERLITIITICQIAICKTIEMKSHNN
jgi:hypothetical protein